MIYFQRIIDNYVLSDKMNFTLRNRIKSVDELAYIDTLVMDDYFFRKRTIPEGCFERTMNPESPLHN